MLNYSQIYINGDSYSALTDSHKVYSEFLSEQVNCKLINRAIAGSSNDRIFRRTIEDILDSPGDFYNGLVIVGVSFITRDEIWVNDTKDRFLMDIDKWPNSKFTTANFLFNDLPTEKLHMITDLNINRQLVHFYTKLYMFIKTLECLGVAYFIFSAANNTDWNAADFTFLKNLHVFKQCSSNDRLFNIHDFNIEKFALDNNLSTTTTGHLFEDGHKKFCNFLIDKISRLS